MSEYFPDKFVVIEIKSSHYPPTRKVLGSWYGGFAGANSWRISSPIEKVLLVGDVYQFHNASGSVYYCHKDTEGMSMLTESVYNGWLAEAAASTDGSNLHIVPSEEYEAV